MINKRGIWILLTFLAFLGLADSIWLHIMQGDLATFGAACRMVAGFDCAPALRSEWGSLFGLPLSSYGIGIYTLLFLIALQSIWKEAERDRNAFFLFLLSGASFLFVVRLAYISMVRLSDYCLFCLVIHVLTIAIFVLSASLFASAKSTARELLRSEWKTLASDKRLLALFLLAIFLIVLGIPYLGNRSRMAILDDYPYERDVLDGKAPRFEGIDQLIASRPFRGSADAAVTIVEFGDFTCPVCREASLLMESFVEKYDVRFVFIPFPRSRECNPLVENARAGACYAALAAEYGLRSGQFWQVHDAIFRDKELIDTARMEELAAKAGAASHDELLADTAALMALREDIMLAAQFNVVSTPTLVVNGLVIGSLPPRWYMEELIEREMKRSAAK